MQSGSKFSIAIRAKTYSWLFAHTLIPASLLLCDQDRPDFKNRIQAICDSHGQMKVPV